MFCGKARISQIVVSCQALNFKSNFDGEIDSFVFVKLDFC